MNTHSNITDAPVAASPDENPYDAARRLGHELVDVLDRCPEAGRAVIVTTDENYPVMVVFDKQHSLMMGRLNAYKARHDAMRADPTAETCSACEAAHAALVASFAEGGEA